MFVFEISDELRLRQCFERALLCNCTEILQAVLTNGMLMGLLAFLERRHCINKLDSLYLKSKHDDLSASTRMLFRMITNRDLKTLFTFIWTLKYFNKSLHLKITRQTDTSHTSDSLPLLCLRCILIDRVEAYQVAAHLFQRCNNLRKWYKRVIAVGWEETERLWEELFDVVESLQINIEVREAILEAIEDCGFHSDILKMLQEDKQLERNTFECRCSENRADSADKSDTCQESSRHSQMSNYDGVTPNQRHTHEIYRRSAVPATCAHSNDVQDENSAYEKREDRSGLPYTCFENHNHNLTYEKCERVSDCATHAHDSNDVQGKYVTSESLTDTPGCHNNSLNDQMNSNSLKRKNLDVGGENAEGSRRKKSSLLDESSTSHTMANRSNHLKVSDKKTIVFQRCNSNSDTSSEHKEGKRGSVKEDTSDNLKMDELKEAVDIQSDSGVSPGQSLNSFKSENSETDNDSGYYDKNKRDKDETIPKVIAVATKTKLPQQTAKAPLQSEDPVEQGSAASDSNLEVIDADHPEGTDLNVNHDILLDALDEPWDGSASGSIQDVSENNSEGANSKKSESNTRNEPFINIQVKKRS